ncbi:hypothetical protein [Candidatus Poriferisodalis sp.]|uniref:hypothetical protein n=1 Tax=Candidatus Poriferisodalis sp. TaxID=3101277 RepID=UPI003B02D235
MQRSEAGSDSFTTIEDNTDTDYAYRVIAVNSDGSSPPSHSHSVRTPPALTLEEEVVHVPTPDQDALTPTLEEVVHVPPPDEVETLIAMYQMSVDRVTAYTATMTAGGSIAIVDGTTWIYTGFGSGTPLTFGSMSETDITANTGTWGAARPKAVTATSPSSTT